MLYIYSTEKALSFISCSSNYTVYDSQTVVSSFFIASKIDFSTSLQFLEKSFPPTTKAEKNKTI